MFELFLIAIGLSMDAFAISVCKGLSMDNFKLKPAIIIALYFGLFQALMPLLGWGFGVQLENFVSKYAHIISFVLLFLIGGKMIIEASFENDNCLKCFKLSYSELFVLAVATSIDAFAVGVTFAFLNVSILKSIIIIGLTTFILSLFGVLIGNKFKLKNKIKPEIIGGVILILIGFKILFEKLLA